MKKCSTCKGTGRWEDDHCPDCMGSGFEIPDSWENKPILTLTDIRGRGVNILGRAHKVAIENDLDWDKIHDEVVAVDESQVLITLGKYFVIE